MPGWKLEAVRFPLPAKDFPAPYLLQTQDTPLCAGHPLSPAPVLPAPRVWGPCSATKTQLHPIVFHSKNWGTRVNTLVSLPSGRPVMPPCEGNPETSQFNQRQRGTPQAPRAGPEGPYADTLTLLTESGDSLQQNGNLHLIRFTLSVEISLSLSCLFCSNFTRERSWYSSNSYSVGELCLLSGFYALK